MRNIGPIHFQHGGQINLRFPMRLPIDRHLLPNMLPPRETFFGSPQNPTLLFHTANTLVLPTLPAPVDLTVNVNNCHRVYLISSKMRD